MTDPAKFDAAARLLRALDKMDRKYADKSQAMIAKHAAERTALLAAADPEARALVLAEPGFPVEISCDHCHQGALR